MTCYLYLLPPPYCLWTTNASRLSKKGDTSPAPFTGCVDMVSFDTKYSANDFASLAKSLENEIRERWPDRIVETHIYEGKQIEKPHH
jgi:hypothetical protein